MTTYICDYAFTCFIYELYVDETEINYEMKKNIYIIQVLNYLPTDKNILRYHTIDCYALHTSTTRKTGFRKFSFCVCFTTRPQWSPVMQS